MGFHFPVETKALVEGYHVKGSRHRDEPKVIDLRMFANEELAKRSAASGTKRRRGAGGVGKTNASGSTY